MKIRRSYIAVQTCGFTDKSEHLAAEGLHCCLATLGQCQGRRHLWMGLRAPALCSPHPSRRAHSSPFIAWALLWGPKASHRVPSWQARAQGGGASYLPLPCPLPCPCETPLPHLHTLSRTLLCPAHPPPSSPPPPPPPPPGSTFQSISGAILGGIVCTITPHLLSPAFLAPNADTSWCLPSYLLHQHL